MQISLINSYSNTGNNNPSFGQIKGAKKLPDYVLEMVAANPEYCELSKQLEKKGLNLFLEYVEPFALPLKYNYLKLSSGKFFAFKHIGDVPNSKIGNFRIEDLKAEAARKLAEKMMRKRNRKINLTRIEEMSKDNKEQVSFFDRLLTMIGLQPKI